MYYESLRFYKEADSIILTTCVSIFTNVLEFLTSKRWTNFRKFAKIFEQ